MKRYILLLIFFILIFPLHIKSRGGRGRGGGGMFGNWRKGKKTGTAYYGRSKPEQLFKPNSQFDLKYHSYFKNTHYHNSQSLHFLQLPPEVSYPSSVPTGAIYYPHTPPYTTNWALADFQLWYTTQQILSSTLHSVNHIVHTNNWRKNKMYNEDHIEETTQTNGQLNTDIPLAPFNDSILINATGNALQSTIVEISTNTTDDQNHTSIIMEEKKSSYGFICMPMMINETDANNINEQVQVSKLVCFPAPPFLQKSCVLRTTIETDSNDAKKTIEVTRPLCSTPKKEKSEPVIGDIIDPIDTTEVNTAETLTKIKLEK